jgi:hypothetical protein
VRTKVWTVGGYKEGRTSRVWESIRKGVILLGLVRLIAKRACLRKTRPIPDVLYIRTVPRCWRAWFLEALPCLAWLLSALPTYPGLRLYGFEKSLGYT